MVRSDVFELQLDVNHYGSFEAKEVTIRLVEDNVVLIEGKQDWRHHPGGRVWKAFAHEHTLPKDVDSEKLTAFMTGQGVLMIRAPRISTPRSTSSEMLLQQHEQQAHRSSISMRSLGLTDIVQDLADGQPDRVSGRAPRNLPTNFNLANLTSNVQTHKNVTLGGVTEFKYRVWDMYSVDMKYKDVKRTRVIILFVLKTRFWLEVRTTNVINKRIVSSWWLKYANYFWNASGFLMKSEVMLFNLNDKQVSHVSPNLWWAFTRHDVIQLFSIFIVDFAWQRDFHWRLDYYENRIREKKRKKRGGYSVYWRVSSPLPQPAQKPAQVFEVPAGFPFSFASFVSSLSHSDRHPHSDIVSWSSSCPVFGIDSWSLYFLSSSPHLRVSLPSIVSFLCHCM